VLVIDSPWKRALGNPAAELWVWSCAGAGGKFEHEHEILSPTHATQRSKTPHFRDRQRGGWHQDPLLAPMLAIVTTNRPATQPDGLAENSRRQAPRRRWNWPPKRQPTLKGLQITRNSTSRLSSDFATRERHGLQEPKTRDQQLQGPSARSNDRGMAPSFRDVQRANRPRLISNFEPIGPLFCLAKLAYLPRFRAGIACGRQPASRFALHPATPFPSLFFRRAGTFAAI
jgi:hypothetical protein